MNASEVRWWEIGHADGMREAEARLRERLARDIEALGFPRGQLLACYITGELAAQVGKRPYECPVHKGDACLFVFAAVTDVLAVVRGVGEAKP